MARQSLYQVVNNATSSNGKSAIGYNVSSYKNVLEGLQQEISSDGGGEIIFGIGRGDYSGVSSMTFNEKTGMSQNDDAIWKMVITVTGACPVIYENSYDIARFEHETLSNKNRNPFGNVDEMCPQMLTQDTLNSIQTEDFKVGAAVDLHNLALEYFKKYYSHSGTEITAEMVTKLFTKKCIRAQVIFPNNNKSLLIDVIQQTPFSNMACIYISTPIASAEVWRDCGIAVNIKADNKTYPFIPTGDRFVSAVNGEIYNVGKGTMNGMNKTNYEMWLKNSADKFVNGAQTLWLQKVGQPKTCYVKLFIPIEKRAEAMQILPYNVNKNIFQQYEGIVHETKTQDNTIIQGDYAVVCDGLCREWGDIRINEGSGSINYGLFKPNLSCRTLVKDVSGVLYTFGGKQFIPKFGSNDTLYLDCSAFACFMTINALANSNLLKDNVMSMTVYGTSAMKTYHQYLNKNLKPGYKAVCLPITNPSDIKTGDIIFCNNVEKGQYKGTSERFGHAAWAFVDQGKLKTLEIGGESKKKLLQEKVRTTTPKNGKYFYRNLIRIVKV